MTSNVDPDELTKDLEECQRLVSEATRFRTKTVLDNEVKRIQTEIENLKRRPSTATPTSDSTSPPVSVLPTVKVNTYAWDQSDKFLKLYVTVHGAAHGAGQESRIQVSVQPRSVDFYARDIAGKNYEFVVKGLLHPVLPEGSEFKVKKDIILLLLKKQNEGKAWGYVTEVEMQHKEKHKPKMDEKEDANAGLTTLMKQMYDDGDDEMKRTINKAWYEAQEKKKTGGGGGDGGLSDFM